MEPAVRIVVSGVSAVGKSTVGKALAERVGAAFVDADDLHPPANVAKMAAGTALTDDDRWPWLDAVASELAGSDRIVVACSALRRAHRDRIRSGAAGTVFIQLIADRDSLRARAEARQGHFMPATLLDSQLEALEALAPDEAGATVPVGGRTADQVADAVREALGRA